MFYVISPDGIIESKKNDEININEIVKSKSLKSFEINESMTLYFNESEKYNDSFLFMDMIIKDTAYLYYNDLDKPLDLENKIIFSKDSKAKFLEIIENLSKSKIEEFQLEYTLNKSIPSLCNISGYSVLNDFYSINNNEMNMILINILDNKDINNKKKVTLLFELKKQLVENTLKQHKYT